jgi:ATP-dependent exoDNAse (exonuclease V) alpha subunit
MLQGIKKAYEMDNWEVRGLAFQGKASEELFDGSGIESSTIHSFLNNFEKKDIKKKELWVIDESSTVDNNLMHELMLKAKKKKSKIVFLGDKHQLQPIGVGNAFSQAVQQKKINYTEMKDIIRQKNGTLKEAVYSVLKGNIKKALKLLDKKIVEINDDDQRYDLIAKKYLSQTSIEQKNSLILTGYNADRIEINSKINKSQFAKGTGAIYDIDDKKNLRSIEVNRGERIIFLENNRKLGVKNGTLGTVEFASKNYIEVLTDKGKSIKFNPSEYNKFDYGYAVTTHKSQGTTVDKVFININTEQYNINSLNKFYVDLSRAKYDAELFVNNKEELADSFKKWHKKIGIKDFNVDKKLYYEKMGVIKVPESEISVYRNESDWSDVEYKENDYLARNNYDGTYDLYTDYTPENCPYQAPVIEELENLTPGGIDRLNKSNDFEIKIKPKINEMALKLKNSMGFKIG